MQTYASPVVAAANSTATGTSVKSGSEPTNVVKEPTDAEITQEIKKQISAVPDLGYFKISVTTVNGVVYLEGVPRSKNQVYRIVEIAKGVKGVKSVNRSKIYALER